MLPACARQSGLLTLIGIFSTASAMFDPPHAYRFRLLPEAATTTIPSLPGIHDRAG
jgi:hypothetical protein